MNTEIREYLPFIIPLVIVQFTLLGYTIRHILTHDSYKHGSRAVWLIVTLIGMNFWGPILYFIIGKEEE
ncbi:MAG: PLDc N-terminal domain-containing protein [Ruminococcus sp.]|nr:PLDc N-terminal domain-containing protein [Ruminococcus sp.]